MSVIRLHSTDKARILNAMKRASVVGVIILAFFGLSDSVYIAQTEAANIPLLCNVNNLSGCNIVAASRYSHLFGIPLATYGVIFFGILFVLAALELVIYNRSLRRLLQGISLIGFMVSLYFTFVEIFVIRALCIYCLVSAGIMLFVLVAVGFIEPIRKKIIHSV